MYELGVGRPRQQGLPRIHLRHAARRSYVPGTLVDVREAQFIANVPRQFREQRLRTAPIALGKRVGVVGHHVDLRDAGGEVCLAQASEPVPSLDFAGHLSRQLGDAVIGREARFPPRLDRIDLAQVERALLAGPVVHVLEQVLVDGAPVFKDKVARDRCQVKLLNADGRGLELRDLQNPAVSDP